MLDRLGGAAWGEELMAIEPSAMRGFEPRHLHRGERADVDGVPIYWDECGMSRVGSVALIRIEGPLSRIGGWYSCGYDQLLEAHARANASDARSVLQVVHSPGGYISGLDECANQIEAMFRASGKPLHSLAADASYSAAFRLACAASKRWVTRAGGVGNIGILTTRPDFSKALAAEGVRIEHIASGECKTDGYAPVPLTPEEIARIKDRVDYHMSLFADAASRATGLTVAEVIAQQGALYLGPRALDARLVSGVSTLAECVARLEQETQGRPMVAIPNTGLRGQQSAKGKQMGIEMLALAFGLAADAKDQDVMTRAQALVATETKLREVTGKTEGAAALAVIEGWRASAEELTGARVELKRITDREEKSAFAGLVKAGEESAQITPGNRAKVLEKFPTSAQLAAYLETAPAALPGQANAGEKQPKVATDPATSTSQGLAYKGKAYADLSFSERAAWNRTDPEAWRQAKAEYDRSKGGE